MLPRLRAMMNGGTVLTCGVPTQADNSHQAEVPPLHAWQVTPAPQAGQPLQPPLHAGLEPCSEYTWCGRCVGGALHWTALGRGSGSGSNNAGLRAAGCSTFPSTTAQDARARQPWPWRGGSDPAASGCVQARAVRHWRLHRHCAGVRPGRGGARGACDVAAEGCYVAGRLLLLLIFEGLRAAWRVL